MRRDLPALSRSTFDLLVVGAGIHGACAAWDATLRGLSVALVDQGDFGAGTSANSLRIVHGGLRYLARGNLGRMRESILERSTLLRIAPGLVQPLPVLVPVYGTGLRGRMALGTALALNDLSSWGRNKDLDPARLIPPGRLVSRGECLDLFPGFDPKGLTGGALWHDAQLLHPERLTLSFLMSAANLGAVPANYVRVDRLLTANGAVHGARATDLMTGAELDIAARAVLVAAGPWTQDIVAGAQDSPPRARHPQVLALNLVVTRRLADLAIGVQARSGPREDPVCGGGRYLFCAPQGEGTVLGTWYTADAADPAAAQARGRTALLREMNDACPGLALGSEEIIRCQWGWLPLKGGQEPGRPGSLAERPRIVDHGRDAIDRLLSVEGVKFTTARRVAQQAIDRVFKSLHRTSPACVTSERLLDGAGPEESPRDAAVPGREDIVRAVHQEMAVKLGDVFRRASSEAARPRARLEVEAVARVVASELGWDAVRQGQEVDAVMREAGVQGASLETVA